MSGPSQHLLRLTLQPGALIYASRFRELLAKSEQLPNAFFHLDDAGETIKALPGIRIVGGRGWVGILANESDRQLLYSAVGPAISVVTNELRVPVQAHIEQIEVGVAATQFPVEYWVRELVIRRRRKWVQDLPLEQVVSRTILRGLETFAEQSGLILPTVEQLELDNLEISKHLYLPLQTRHGTSAFEHANLVDAKFTLFAELKGHWVVGNFQSRGYGRIGRDLQALAVHYHREERTPRSVLQ